MQLNTPLVLELPKAPAPAEALSRFRRWSRPVLFQSAASRPELGRDSFLTAGPLLTWDVSLEELHQARLAAPEAESATQTAFAAIRQALQRFQAPTIPGLPPFQGGLAGVVSYELGGLWEKLPPSGPELTPAVSVGLYDWAIAWNHELGKAWLIVQPGHGLRSTSPAERGREIEAALHSPVAPAADCDAPPARTAGGDPFARITGLASNFDRPSYEHAVARVIRYIHAGDIFQANLSQRFRAPAIGHPIDLYRRLAAVNPAPFAGYYDGGDFQVISASPERFLRLTGDEVETRPIKGTRPRRPGVEADLLTRDELRESEKDRAENVMIVDLLRNDLSRVCRPGSIRVPQLCVVETYETVQHLVSEVRGRLKPGLDFFDLLAATFPGGSITGAPKIRAMEVITELEQVPRGPYCGSLFYVGVDGHADSSILIRTLTQSEGVLHFPAGGGITSQSEPAAEYEETLHKVEGLIRALE